MLRGIWHEVVDRLFGDRPKEKLSPEERRKLFNEILDAQAKIIAELMQAFASFPSGIHLLRIAQLFQSEPTLKDQPSLSDIEIHGLCRNKIYYTTYSSKNHQNPYLRTYDDKTHLVSQGEVMQTAYERATNIILAINLEAEAFLNEVKTGSQQLIVLNFPKEESQKINVDYWQEELRKRNLDVDDKSLKIQISREHRVILTCEIQGDTYDFYELFQYSTDRRVLVCLKEKSPHPSTKRGHPIRPDVILPALVRA